MNKLKTIFYLCVAGFGLSMFLIGEIHYCFHWDAKSVSEIIFQCVSGLCMGMGFCAAALEWIKGDKSNKKAE